MELQLHTQPLCTVRAGDRPLLVLHFRPLWWGCQPGSQGSTSAHNIYNHIRKLQPSGDSLLRVPTECLNTN